MKALVLQTGHSQPNYSWLATINGPWYDDSNPQGYGATREEAEANAWKQLLHMQTQINDFISQGKPEFQLTK